MTSGEYRQPSNEFGPDEIMYIAGAIASRSLAESSIVNRILQESLGGEYQEPTEEDKKKEELKTVALLMKVVENPYSASLLERVEAAFGTDFSQRLADELHEHSEGELSVDPEQLSQALIGVQMELMDKAGINDESVAKDFSRMFNSAQYLAQQKGVHVAEVYQSEEMYLEATRMASTPQEMAEKLLALKNAMAAAQMQLTLDAFVSLVRGAVEDITEEEIEEFIQELKTAPEVQVQLEALMNSLSEAVQKISLFMINRVWGYEALVSLPSEIKKELIPTYSETEEE